MLFVSQLTLSHYAWYSERLIIHLRKTEKTPNFAKSGGQKKGVLDGQDPLIIKDVF